MTAVAPADNIAHVVKIRFCHGTGDGAGGRKEASHGDLRKRVRDLDGKFRTQVAEGGCWQVRPAANIAGVANPNLVDKIRPGRPGVTDVDILLAPTIGLYAPGDVTVRLTAGGIQRRDAVVSGGV